MEKTKTEKLGEIKPTKDLVNKLIEESFGKGFQGNYKTTLNNLKEVDYLSWIGKNRSNGKPIVVGCFQHRDEKYNELIDGSQLSVHESYVIEAAKYSLLYERITGKKPLVKLH